MERKKGQEYVTPDILVSEAKRQLLLRVRELTAGEDDWFNLTSEAVQMVIGNFPELADLIKCPGHELTVGEVKELLLVAAATQHQVEFLIQPIPTGNHPLRLTIQMSEAVREYAHTRVCGGDFPSILFFLVWAVRVKEWENGGALGSEPEITNPEDAELFARCLVVTQWNQPGNAITIVITNGPAFVALVEA
ncbi:MAG: hypothetical protein JW816_04605 [Candidatus Buchananbacteria bacterium]|nr:hypothetical protein [Candidatus Buchananbacteria bacterium]